MYGGTALIMILSMIIVTSTKTSVDAFRLLPRRVGKNGGTLALFSSASSPSSAAFQYTQLEDSPMVSSTSTSTSTSTSMSKDQYRGNRNLQHVLRIAENAALKAGEIMRSTSGKIAISNTKTNTADLVTESDILCQKVINDIIQNEFPGDCFLGEEDVGAGSFASSSALDRALFITKKGEGGDSGNACTVDAIGGIQDEDDKEKPLWIVDPIDGTTNFQAGLPMFCVSIGVVSLGGSDASTDDDPQVVAGVIYNPILNEMVSAVRGRGCYLNGERIKRTNDDDDDNDVNDSDDGITLDKALVNVGFPVYSEGTLRVSSRTVTALSTKVRGVRMIASASQVMSWVAMGKLSAYVSWDLNAWDIAAGMVIVEESGGFISDFDGERATILTRDMIISCNEGNSKHNLSKAILQVLKENDCIEYQ